jgi:hypothetical protein
MIFPTGNFAETLRRRLTPVVGGIKFRGAEMHRSRISCHLCMNLVKLLVSIQGIDSQLVHRWQQTLQVDERCYG